MLYFHYICLKTQNKQMKQLLTLTIIFVFSFVASSQEIVNTAKLWSCMEEHCHEWGSEFSTDFYRFEEDTIINSLTYKKVWISEDENHEIWNFYGAFIREENNRVYYRQMFGDEGLIYDFNLEIGDSVLVDNPRAVGEVWLHLLEIDTITVADGLRERWRMVSSEYQDSDYWIRGIGSIAGVINSSMSVYGGLCGFYALLCQDEQGEKIYENPEYNTCYLYTVGRDEVTEDNTSIIYNRDLSSIVVKLQDKSDMAILITDISGKILYKTEVNSKKETIPFRINNPGIYIVTVVVNSQKTSIKLMYY
ncbi:MAG: hypothetical protein CMF58_07965 [Lentimicrobiaceae bacterium]|jgi:hypothetical protein|nr:hypothetical protein [Lentimicrobiaceae bacterium]